MLELMKLVTVIMVAVTMSLPLAHVLEWPGKLRLTREHYLAVQPIYYPGFTYAGFAEPVSILLVLSMLVFTPLDATEFWLTSGAFLSLLAMHASYWFLTHPLNNFWLEGFGLKGFGRKFFGIGTSKRGEANTPDWIWLRDRWELSHAIRALLGLTSFILVVTAVC